MRWRAACSVRRLRRSALAWSGRSQSGNGLAAALMGACGYLLSSRSVFLVTFMLTIPTLLALARIREREIDVAQSHGAAVRAVPDKEATSVFHLLRQRPLLIFAGG